MTQTNSNLPPDSDLDATSDFHVEIDELFKHMIENLDYQIDQPLEWIFGVEGESVAQLEQFADQLPDNYRQELQEEVKHMDADGNTFVGGPMLSLIRCEALSPNEVKACCDEIDSLAKKSGLRLSDVTSYDAIDEEEFFDWLSLEDALWRLRHFTSSGMDTDAELPWLFLVFSPSLEQLNAAYVALDANDLGKVEKYDEPDEEGNYGLCLFMNGKNNEVNLTEMFDSITGLVQPSDSTIAGIQFLDEDDFNDIYGSEDEDED